MREHGGVSLCRLQKAGLLLAGVGGRAGCATITHMRHRSAIDGSNVTVKAIVIIKPGNAITLSRAHSNERRTHLNLA